MSESSDKVSVVARSVGVGIGVVLAIFGVLGLAMGWRVRYDALFAGHTLSDEGWFFTLAVLGILVVTLMELAARRDDRPDTLRTCLGDAAQAAGNGIRRRLAFGLAAAVFMTWVVSLRPLGAGVILFAAAPPAGLVAGVAFARRLGMTGVSTQVAEAPAAGKVVTWYVAWAALMVTASPLLAGWPTLGEARDVFLIRPVVASVAILIGIGILWLVNRSGSTAGVLDTYSPGDVVWATIPFDEVDDEKDRPVAVYRVRGELLDVMYMTSKNKDHVPTALYVGEGRWDPQGRPSWLDTGRIVTIMASDVRRSGGRIPEGYWQQALALRNAPPRRRSA